MNNLRKKLLDEQENYGYLQGIDSAIEVSIEERVNRIREKQWNGTEKQKLFAVMYSTLHKAAQDGNCEGILHFINSRINHIDDYDVKGLCALHYAAERGHVSACALIIKRGCDVDVRSVDESTAVMFAAKNGHVPVIRLLHESGAELLALNRSGLSAAHYACQGDHAETLQILLELFRDDQTYIRENNKKINNDTSIPYEVTEHNTDNPSGGSSDDTRHTRFLEGCIVAQKYFTLSIQDLLFRPSHHVIDLPSNNGARPLHLAATVDARNCVEYLLDSSILPNNIDNNGDSALHKAGRFNHFTVYRLLVSKGADESLINMMRESPQELLRDESHIY
jgi:ankyrin repeat protein